MKKLLIALGLLLSGCASMDAADQDQAQIAKYPQCYHQLRVVFDACVKQNQAGVLTNAVQIEGKMQRGEI